MVSINSGSMSELKMSLMKSSSVSSGPEEEKYFTYANPEINRSLHVVDADYGVFESNQRKRMGNFRLKTHNFIKRFKEKEPSNYVVLDDDEDDLRLRPEPELVRSSTYDRSQTGPSLQFEAAQKRDVFQQKAELPSVQKSKVEAQYDALKLKAAKYKAERNMQRTKLENHKMALKLREYEYYCVNGIDHQQLELDSGNDTGRKLEYGRGYLNTEYRQRRKESKKKAPFFRTTASSKSSRLQPNFLDQLSRNLPPEAAMFIEYYGDLIPSTGTIREFHKAVLGWVYTVPLLSLVYPVLYILGTFIPRHSKRSWSVRALFVGFLDLCILLVTGWAIYNIFNYSFFVVSKLFQVVRFLRII
ncbi:hypothetical protein PMKS-003573 [Pichia membranifaciens]|uniref:Uncharacterized protein n=1 Tax=Pichia membranifaciens TaxID=4926 RepID=A0A1Q2YKJ6_9ASCO|nr:hypothetical protein PMKS-003573 [Pichia membranifaciens]